MKPNMIKWRLMLTTLPFTFVILLIKLGLVYGIEFEGLVKFSEVSIVMTGGIFLIGFMLAGTMADYKESEKLPSELACAIETIEDTLVLAHGFKGGFDLQDMRVRLNEVTASIIQWLKQGGSEKEVYDKIQTITHISLTLEKAGVGAIANRVTGEQHNLRKIFSRINVIRKTNFLATGYALLEVLSIVIIMLLLISRFEEALVMVIIVCFVSQIFLYMLRLIRDVDQPFEYLPSGRQQASDVDLFPLLDYHQRAISRI